MRIRRRLGVGMFAVILLAGSVPAAAPAIAAEPPSSTPTTPLDAAVPDPVTFVPEAGRDEVRLRPEATIGFGSRDLLAPRRIQPGTDLPDGFGAETLDPAPAATPQTGTEDPQPAPEPVPATPIDATGAPPDAQPQTDSGSIEPLAEGAPQITGIVRDPGGEPLEGMLVCLDALDGSPTCVAMATSGADGTYAVEAPVGSWHLRAADPGGVFVPGYWSGTGWTRFRSDAQAVTIDTSDVTGVDFTLPFFPFVRGTLTNGSGEPLAGLTVMSSFYVSTTTAADGSYAIRIWPETQTTINVYATMVYRPGWYSDNGFVTEQALATTLDIGYADVTGIDLVVPAWPRIAGRVTDVDGDAVASLPVEFVGGSTRISTKTAADGTYGIHARFDLNWTVQFGQGGEWRIQSIPVATDDDVVLDVVMHRYPVISGRIVNPSGGPAAGVTVDVLGPDWNFRRSATTDEDGAFAIAWWYGSPIRVSFQDPSGTYVNGVLGSNGYSSDYDHFATFPISDDEILDASITMPAYVQITGHIRLGNGTPVAGGDVQARSLKGSTWADVASDGSFSIRIAPGTYSLVVPGGYYGREGFAYETGAVEPFDVGHDGRDVDVVLPASQRIKGKVTAGGTGRAGIEVDVYLDGSPFATLKTASDGTYSIGLPPGAYLVGFYDATRTYAHGWYGPSGYTSDPKAAKLVPLGTTDVTGINVTLPATRRISGKVVEKSYGAAARYVFVEAFVNGVYYSSQYATSSGTYNLPVAPGKVTLWVYDPSMFVAPGWRTSTSLTANYAIAAVTTVGSSNVTGVTIRAPEARILNLSIGWVPVPGSFHSFSGSVEAVAYGAAASFDVRDSAGNRRMPLLSGTYRFWIDSDETAYRVIDGWYRNGTVTPDVALSTTMTVPTNSTLKITVPTGEYISGSVLDKDGYPIGGIEVQLYVNGSFYTSTVPGSGGFSLVAPPGTYRLGFVDLFGMYRSGWLGPNGFVSDYAAARNLTVTAGAGLDGLAVRVPMDSPPAPPTNVVATPFHESVVVSFAPSAGSVTRPIIHHAVTASPGGRQCIAVGQASCTVTGLTNGTAYTFRVTASSIVGASAPSAASTSVTPRPVPNAPGSVLAQAAGSLVAVSWAAPADHGFPITGYKVAAMPGTATCAPVPATATACTLPPLANGRYTIAVTASNAQGWGPASKAAVTVDTVAPTVTAPKTALRHGVSMSGANIPMTVTWTASDALSGVADTRLQASGSSGVFNEQTLATPTTTSVQRTLGSNSYAYRFRALAADGSGNVSGWATGAATYMTLRQETGSGIAYGGSWGSASSSSALGGRLRYTSNRYAWVTYTFTGRGVSFVSRKGPTSGKIAVYLDGVRVATPDLYGSSTTVRWVTWSRTLASSGKHTLKIVNLGTSGRPRFYIDGFATIR